MWSPLVWLHLTSVTLKGQYQGHSDFESLYLVKEPSSAIYKENYCTVITRGALHSVYLGCRLREVVVGMSTSARDNNM